MNWNELTTKQKRHAIFHVLYTRKLAFWFVCGKEAQRKYTATYIDDDNVDGIRDEVYNLYIVGLNKPRIFDKELKLETIKKFLGKQDVK